MTKRPLVLHINTVADPRNGVGQIVRALATAATKEVFRSQIIAGYGNPADSDYVVESDTSYYLNVLKSRMFADDGFLRSSASKALCRIIQALHPDLVHLHNLHGYYCDITTLKDTLDRLNIPVVLTLHDLWMTTGRCAYPPNGDCPELKRNACRECPFPRRYPAKWLKSESRLSEKLDFLDNITLVAPSRWIADRVPNRTVTIIPNGIDPYIFSPSNTQKRQGLIAIAGRWNRTKGIDDILRLADVLPDGEYISLVGKSVPKHPKIKNLGAISNPQILADVLRRHRALLSASHEEAFGLTVAEALATGTPAIVRSGTGPEEQLADKSFAVDFSKPTEVLRAIERLDEYKLPEHVNSLEAMNEQYYDLYRRLLNS